MSSSPSPYPEPSSVSLQLIFSDMFSDFVTSPNPRRESSKTQRPESNIQTPIKFLKAYQVQEILEAWNPEKARCKSFKAEDWTFTSNM